MMDKINKISPPNRLDEAEKDAIMLYLMMFLTPRSPSELPSEHWELLLGSRRNGLAESLAQKGLLEPGPKTNTGLPTYKCTEKGVKLCEIYIQKRGLKIPSGLEANRKSSFISVLKWLSKAAFAGIVGNRIDALLVQLLVAIPRILDGQEIGETLTQQVAQQVDNQAIAKMVRQQMDLQVNAQAMARAARQVAAQVDTQAIAEGVTQQVAPQVDIQLITELVIQQVLKQMDTQAITKRAARQVATQVDNQLITELVVQQVLKQVDIQAVTEKATQQAIKRVDTQAIAERATQQVATKVDIQEIVAVVTREATTQVKEEAKEMIRVRC